MIVLLGVFYYVYLLINVHDFDYDSFGYISFIMSIFLTYCMKEVVSLLTNTVNYKGHNR